MTDEAKPRVILVGAGYTLTRVANLAIRDGFEVFATKRTPDEIPGVTVKAWDGGEFPFADEAKDAIVIYSVPPSENFQVMAKALHASETATRFVYLSSTSVYGPDWGDDVDESSKTNPKSPAGMKRAATEDLLQLVDTPSVAVRIAGIYGPGRTLKDYIEKGRYKLVNPDKVTNRIHVDDLANIIWLAATHETDTKHWVVNAADGNPQKVGDLIDFLVENYGMKQPDRTTIEAYEAERGPSAAARWRASSRVVPKVATEELGYEFLYPNVFDGYRAILGQK